MEKKEEKPPDTPTNRINLDLLIAACDKILARWEAAQNEKAA